MAADGGQFHLRHIIMRYANELIVHASCHYELATGG